MAADEGNVKIEKFDGADFGFWNMHIEDFLYQKNLYQPLSGKQPEGMKNEDWALLDRQALGVIRLTLSRNVAFNIAKEKTMVGLMAALSSMYEKPSASNKVHLMRQLKCYCYSSSSSSGNNKLKFDDVRDLRQQSIESWILDSGASFHSTPCREIMENYVSDDFGKVHIADDETLKIVGKGDIRLKLPNQTSWMLKGVRHIPGLKRNLISVGQLDGEGYNTTFSGCEWKIIKGALVIARGKKTVLSMLGHMSEKGMKTLLLKGKLSDLKSIDVGLCEDCIFGTQKKVSFTKIGKTPKAKKLELVHTDVWGPSSVPSLAGSLYYVTFIDDSTRKRLRSDNGREYKNRRFRDFCANNGIKMETTVMTPQQNGIVERMNKTLNERARSMRIHVKLPKFLWAEANNTAAYLINRGPSVPLDGGIPEEVWSKKEINLSHLRVFGCISYVYINSAERSKLDAKSNKCAFVGYGGDEFGYRFWDYKNQKIIRSRDVIFNENMVYKDMSTIESSSSNIEDETKEFTEFKEISGNDVQISPEAVQEEPGTPELRRSSRIPKPTQRYSPSLHYLLLTDNGEPECYDEAMTKEEHDRSKRYKARFVVKGFQQKEAAENLHLEQLDVKKTFHGDLEEEIYMRQPKGFIEAGKKNLMPSRSLLLHQEAEYINKVLSRFNMQDAKLVSTPLGVHFRLSKEQSPKTEEERAHMVNVSYASAMGSLMYAIVCTRPDIAQAVGAVSRYMNNPGKVHWEAVKWILRYMRGYVYTLGGTALFKAFALDFDTLFPKAVPNAIKTVELLQGDGGVGSWGLNYLKHRVDELDEDNLSYAYSLLEGEILRNIYETIRFETKFVAAADGGTICKMGAKFYTIGDVEINEDQIKAEAEKRTGAFKAVADYLLANPDN
ncbi:Major allergen Pru ar 1 [Hibiscus syriacus]|uniref:Major allergen Pru ar 1 n=1 Tax=Hibiscus syriacus TaxID=106335 RepID=A0A6A3CTZ2_HIBSY|nr:Major allergen Pru ar 1 [Hibiscus syriacus]